MSVRLRATLVAVALSTSVAFASAAPASAAPVAAGVSSSASASGHLSARDPFPKLTPAKIMAKSSAAAKTAKTVRVHATGKTDEGEVATIDVTITKTAGSVRYTASKSGTYTAVRYGKDMFLMGDAKFWQSSMDDKEEGKKAAKALAGKWIQLTGTSKDLKEMRDESTLAYWLSDLNSFRPTKRVKGTSVKGKATVGLVDSTGTDGYTVYVAAQGVPFPMLAVANDKSSSTMFYDWNRSIKVAKPKAAIVLPGNI